MKQDVARLGRLTTDEESRMAIARQVIEDYQLPWLHVMSGRGETDPVWKMFGVRVGNAVAGPRWVFAEDP
jgi:hypothetical protein